MLYCTRVTLDVNGTEITDFVDFTENEQEARVPVNLMNKTGFARKTVRNGCKLTYAHPSDGKPPFDFSIVEGGTITAEREDGVRIVYTGVYHLKTGEAKSDGENGKTAEIEFGAEAKTYA